MIEFFLQNLATIVLSGLLLAVLTGAIVHLVKNKKAGKSACGCNCAGCALHGQCHTK